METAKKTQDLRARWAETKRQLTSGEITAIEAIKREHGLNVSNYSYFFVSCQMRALSLAGIPYVDCKTFDGWKASGFHVIKGEKSKITGLVWVTPTYKDKNGETQESDYSFPKSYYLFHRSQVR